MDYETNGGMKLLASYILFFSIIRQLCRLFHALIYSSCDLSSCLSSLSSPSSSASQSSLALSLFYLLFSLSSLASLSL